MHRQELVVVEREREEKFCFVVSKHYGDDDDDTNQWIQFLKGNFLGCNLYYKFASAPFDVYLYRSACGLFCT